MLSNKYFSKIDKINEKFKLLLQLKDFLFIKLCSIQSGNY